MLRPDSFPFETHLTTPNSQFSEVVGFAEANGLKPLMLDLQTRGGDSIIYDTMVTKRFSAPGYFEALRETAAIRRSMRAAGFKVSRVKIEAAPGYLTFAPRNQTKYYEAHIKVIFPKDRHEAVREAATRFQGHLSRNALVSTQTTFTKFITLRGDVLAFPLFNKRVFQLVSALEKLGMIPASVEAELVLFDNARNHDNAWVYG